MVAAKLRRIAPVTVGITPLFPWLALAFFICFELALLSWGFGFITSGLRIFFVFGLFFVSGFFVSDFFVSDFFSSRSGSRVPAVRRTEPQAYAEHIIHRPIPGKDLLRALVRAGLHSEYAMGNHVPSRDLPSLSICSEHALRGDRPSQSQPHSGRPARQIIGGHVRDSELA